MEKEAKKGVVRVLCLHGYRTSGTILRQQIESRWPKELLQRLELHFPTSPFTARGHSGLEPFFDPPYFEWFYVSNDFREYFNFEEGIDYIEEYMEKHGPFHGILGFSQGALIAAAAPGMQFQGAAFTRVPTINFVILISASVLGGYEFGQPKLAANAFSSPVRCPSLHFIGENDFLRDNGIALLQHFVDPVVIRLQHGHTIPRPDEDSLKKMLCFVEKISKIPSSSSSLITSLAHTSGTLDSQGRSSRTTSRSAL